MDQLKLEKMEESAFDKILIGNDPVEYPLAQGYERFKENLLLHFPDESAAIRNYSEALQSVCGKFPLYNLRSGGQYSEKQEVLEIDAKEFIDSLTANPKLRSVLAGNNILYAGEGGKTPFYIHALVTNSYIESSWKCINGGSQIARLLAKNIRALGGMVLTGKKVTHIQEEGGRIASVRTADGGDYKAQIFISAIHPDQALQMLPTSQLRPAFRRRMHQLENSVSCFSINISLKKNSFPYLRHNCYWHREGRTWDMQQYTKPEWPLGYALFTSPGIGTDQYAETLSILTYMRTEELSPWASTFHTDPPSAGRGESYEQFKAGRAEILLKLVQERFPQLENAIQSCYIATPLSYRDYLGTSDGSLYGIAKDSKDPVKTLISPKTKLPNFYFTGQNLNLHGILGASITALATCNEILGNESLTDKIANA
jgi:all-trans-retinol 13,14-reductase